MSSFDYTQAPRRTECEKALKNPVRESPPPDFLSLERETYFWATWPLPGNLVMVALSCT